MNKLLESCLKIHFFIKKLCSTTENLIFGLFGYVNKQNWQFWNKNQPEALQKLPMHPEKVTVWCGLWAGAIIGPYYFKGAAKRNVIVNGERCREMINNFFLI